jgi:cytochrome P450
MTNADQELAPYPMRRWHHFHPPAELAAIQAGERVVRVTLWDGSHPWLITGYDECRSILSDPRVSTDTDLPSYPHPSAGSAAWHHAIKKTFINMDNPEHDKYRRLFTEDFLIKKVEAKRQVVQGIVDGLIDDMLAGPKPVDLVEVLALPVPSMVICDLLGVPYETRDFFHKYASTAISRTSTPAETVQATLEMIDFIGELIDQKNASPGDDMMSRLVLSQYRTGLLTRDQMAAMFRQMLVAGHETTANMIALGTLALMENPDVLAEFRASDDQALIANTVDELLRWLTILHGGRRRVALEDIEIAGKTIAAGEGIVVAHDIANRDPAAFPEPDTLDIHRRAQHHLAFGYGIHQCLGQPLARVELQVVYSTLFRRIPTMALAAPVRTLRFKDENIAYGVYELPVTW